MKRKKRKYNTNLKQKTNNTNYKYRNKCTTIVTGIAVSRLTPG